MGFAIQYINIGGAVGISFIISITMMTTTSWDITPVTIATIWAWDASRLSGSIPDASELKKLQKYITSEQW